MNTTLRLLAALLAMTLIGVLSAGCSGSSDAPSSSADGVRTGGHASDAGVGSARGKAVRFSECMRSHGVTGFPDPDPSGELTIDAVANDAGVDTSGAPWTQAYDACKSLRPSGFTGRGRTPEQQAYALKFAQCMRDHGIEDFPDPTRAGALIDTTRMPSAAGRGARDIPGFDDAAQACGKLYAADAGVRVP